MIFMVYLPTRKLVTSRGPINRDTAFEKLRMCMPAYGFQHDGVVYFLSGWSPRDVQLLASQGVVERVGKPDEMRTAGIPVPEEFAQYKGSVFYKISAELLK